MVSGSDNPQAPSDGSWWKTLLTALAALVGAVVAWGWLRPSTSPPPTRIGEVPDTPPPAEASETFEDNTSRSLESVAVAIDDQRPPAWVRPTILWTLGVSVAIALAIGLLGALHEVITYLILALFFSFAMEPAVNYMQTRWHWKRGTTTALLLALVMVLGLLVILIFIPTVVKGASAIADRVSESSGEFSTWASDTLGIHVSTESLQSGAQQTSSSLDASSSTPMSVLFGFTASLIGGIFAAFTVAMFIFYMVAEAPQLKRSVLSFLPPQKQEELLSIWESAIEKTGGYFYSRLLLATINGGLFYVMLRILGVPGAAALAFFEGAVAAFIPIVGTYIAAVVPLAIAFITVGATDAFVLLIYVLIYQQVENYLISPKIQGRTMQLHPAIAFGAALAGGAIGGLLWAFLALPFAATVQATASLWVQRHEVVESELTRDVPPPPRKRASEDEPSLAGRARSWLGSKRGWIRREVGSREIDPYASDDASGTPESFFEGGSGKQGEGLAEEAE
jgi:predicted PurR-regulated permease PerM